MCLFVYLCAQESFHFRAIKKILLHFHHHGRRSTLFAYHFPNILWLIPVKENVLIRSTLGNAFKIVQLQLSLEASKGRHFEKLWQYLRNKSFIVVNLERCTLIGKTDNLTERRARVFQLREHSIQLVGKCRRSSQFALGHRRWRSLRGAFLLCLVLCEVTTLFAVAAVRLATCACIVGTVACSVTDIGQTGRMHETWQRKSRVHWLNLTLSLVIQTVHPGIWIGK